jgi:NhaP-type Na+/H+ or K+/H+ antiporter
LHGAGLETDVLVASIGWTVLLSVVLHGFTAVPFARRYGASIAAMAGDIPEREPPSEPEPTGTPADAVRAPMDR